MGEEVVGKPVLPKCAEMQSKHECEEKLIVEHANEDQNDVKYLSAKRCVDRVEKGAATTDKLGAQGGCQIKLYPTALAVKEAATPKRAKHVRTCTQESGH